MTNPRTLSYDTNEYGEVFNGPGTYEALAADVREGPVLVSWIDQQGTLLQVLFALPKRIGQGGLLDNSGDKLIVAVMGKSAYGFTAEVHPNYLYEKLGVSAELTCDRLAKLVNEVLARLRG